jgi:hypothetical protein
VFRSLFWDFFLFFELQRQKKTIFVPFRLVCPYLLAMDLLDLILHTPPNPPFLFSRPWISSIHATSIGIGFWCMHAKAQGLNCMYSDKLIRWVETVERETLVSTATLLALALE